MRQAEFKPLFDSLENADAGAKSDAIGIIFDLVAECVDDYNELDAIIEKTKIAAGRGHGDTIKRRAQVARRAIAQRRRSANEATEVTMQLPTPPPGSDGVPLICNGYVVNDTISMLNNDGLLEIICYTPVVPIAILENHSTGMLSVDLAFFTSGDWKTVTVPMPVIADRRQIIQLSARGVGITSENAAAMVTYLQRIIARNETRIPRRTSASVLGWHGSDFVPYSADVMFDGDPSLKTVFESIHEEGDRDKWLECMREIRKNVAVRLYTDAALAAPVLGLAGKTSFFCNLFGTTGAGKTVTMLAAASQWGDPNEGHLFQKMNSSFAAIEGFMGTLNNIPFFLDELESARSRVPNFSDLIYNMTAGVSRAKGTRSGGLAPSYKWNTVILCTGEAPLTDDDSGAGAINRVVNIECKGDLLDDPRQVADTVRHNYGFAGRKLIEQIKVDYQNREELTAALNQCADELKPLTKATGKQLDYGALLLFMDGYARWLYQDEDEIDPKEIAARLVDMEAISTFNRAFEHVKGWIAQNQSNFLSCGSKGNPTTDADIMPRDLYGQYKNGGEHVAIISSVLKTELSKHNFNYYAFLSAAGDKGVIAEKDNDRGTRNIKTLRIGGILTKCVVLDISERKIPPPER